MSVAVYTVKIVYICVLLTWLSRTGFVTKVVDPRHVYTVHMCVCVWFVSLNLLHTVRRYALDGGSARRKAKVVMRPVKYLVISPCVSEVTTDCYGSGIWIRDFTFSVSYTHRGTALSRRVRCSNNKSDRPLQQSVCANTSFWHACRCLCYV